jgi:predicted dienelactone hydrolase
MTLFSFETTNKQKSNTNTTSWRSLLGFNLAITLFNLSFCLGISSLLTKKAIGAEEIDLNYGALEFSVSVKSLEIYAREGKIHPELRNYAEFLTPEQLKKFKVGLTTNANLDALAIAQFLYSYQGEKILERMSKVIKTKAFQPGFYAIRSALILAAADQEAGGLTPLNVLKKFPTKSIRIDSKQGLEIIENLSKVVQENRKAIAAVEQEAIKESQENASISVDSHNIDLFQAGNYAYRKQVLTMNDRYRQRTFPVDLYLPANKTKKPLPLVIISHGLGGDLTTFEYLAKHLASHGLAVAVPEHPGSNAGQIQSLLSGLTSNVTPPQELIDRPLDIKFLLDQLTKDYGKKLGTQNVGIIGQSFGAYTALALAGATLNFQTLKQECANLDDSWNLSLLLQCLALQLPPTKTYIDLRDDRITSAIAINPLTSAVFGEKSLSNIKIPLMLVSGTSDPITPALPEQIRPFTWLTTREKYLVLLQGGTHFSTLNESAGSIPVPAQAIGPNPKLAQSYIQQLGLAFFGTYLTKQPAYSNYLNAKYVSHMSRSEFPLSLVELLEPESLELQQ